MTTLTEKELARLLRTNPDLALVDDGERPPIILPPLVMKPAPDKPLPLLTEYQMQASIFAMVKVREQQDERWKLVAAVPNGQYRPGERMEPGMRPGYPDITWQIPRAATALHPAYCGLVMELKVGAYDTEPEQEWYLHMLKSQGNFTCVVRDDPSIALEILNWYIEGEE